MYVSVHVCVCVCLRAHVSLVRTRACVCECVGAVRKHTLYGFTTMHNTIYTCIHVCVDTHICVVHTMRMGVPLVACLRQSVKNFSKETPRASLGHVSSGRFASETFDILNLGT